MKANQSYNRRGRAPRHARSPLRYPGGKARVAGALRHYRPLHAREFREPFVGGGSVFFEIGYTYDRVWLNDKHEGLMATYEALRDRPDEFIAQCRAIEPERPDDPLTELGVRGGKPKNARLDAVFDELKLNTECDQALRYLFINRTVHGSGRVNYDIPSRLYFSNPAGWGIMQGDALERAAEALQNARLTCGDYSTLLEAPGEDVWIFCDAPYVVNTNLAPTAQLYQHNFTEEDHRRFADAVRRCEHKVMVTYDDDEEGLVRELFPESDYWIERLEWKYSGTTEKRKRVGRELLILNYVPPFPASSCN